MIETIILSKCDKLVYCESNISLFCIFLTNFKIKKIHLNDGNKSNKIYLSIFQWYIKKFVPHLIRFNVEKIKSMFNSL